MSKTITVGKAKEALQHLRKLTPANPRLDDDLEMSIKELIFFMAPYLIQMSKRGFTIKELPDGLAAETVTIKPGTLNRYLNEYLSAQKDATKSETGPGTDQEKPAFVVEEAVPNPEPVMESGQPGTAHPTPSDNPSSEIENRQPDLASGYSEVPKSSENLKPHSKGGREKSESPPKAQSNSSADDRGE